MSVFTPVSDDDARALLEHYSLGALERLEGIAQGVENTNYFLTTTTGEYVLTLFEHIPRADLPFYVGLMDHLAHHDVTCPAPMRRDDDEMLTEVNGKPAVIVTKLPGAARARPTPHDCRLAGEVLAAIHVAGVEYDAALENWRGAAWREDFARKIAPKVSRASAS
jgi:homoserine kinase type II